MGQYARTFRQIPSILFEHDIYFQSIARQLPGMKAVSARLSATFEYLRALRYELRLLPKVDRVQVCSADNHGTCVLPAAVEQAKSTMIFARASIPRAMSCTLDGASRTRCCFSAAFVIFPIRKVSSGSRAMCCPVSLQQRPERTPRCNWIRSARRGILCPAIPTRSSLWDLSTTSWSRFADTRSSSARFFPVPACGLSCWRRLQSGIPVVSTTIGAEGLGATDGDICAPGR